MLPRLLATIRVFLCCAAVAGQSWAAAFEPVGTVFTYQGQLRQSGSPVNGTADFQFTLFDQAINGSIIGPTLPINNVTTVDGLFTVELDFGAGVFGSQGRWLDIAVRSPAGAGSFTVLSPRQRIRLAPAAQFSLASGSVADGGLSPTYSSVLALTNPANMISGNGTSLTSLNASNISTGTLGNARLGGTYSNAVTLSNAANSYTGNGAGLTSLNASNITTGTLANARTTGASVNTANTLVLRDASGNFSAGAITGNGSGLTNLNANNIGNGTIGSTLLSGMYHNVLTFSNVGNSFNGNGAGLTGLNASNLTTGSLNIARMPAGGTWTLSSNLGITGPAGFIPAFTVISNEYNGIEGVSNASVACGVFGINNSTTGGNGVVGRAASDAGAGVYGVNTSTTGQSYGVVGTNASTSGIGVRGNVTHNTGSTIGVLGETVSTSGKGVHGLGPAFGVFGQAELSGGVAVVGYATALTGATTGVYGVTQAPFGTAVWGESYSTTGGGIGTYGVSSSPQGAGAIGANFATTGLGYGVYGESRSTVGTAVAGFATATTGQTVGVLGSTESPSGFGVLSIGPIGTSGTMTLQIDDPRDPENRYINHFSAEGPEPYNVYTGNVILNGVGEAWVELPDYFEEINTDFRYQLTGIGAPAVLYIAEEIQNNVFQIAGGQPGMKVSWTVTALRNDPWARAYTMPDVMEKPEAQRGKYQHPELYGKPMDLRIGRKPMAPTPKELPTDLLLVPEEGGQ